MSRIRPFCGRILLDNRLRINDLAVAAGGENAAKLLNLTVPAVGLAEGKSVREMAEATGRTPGAITWHLKQIYRRQSISGQVDLLRLVLSLTEFE